MRAVTRRQILIGSAAVSLTALLGACTPKPAATPTVGETAPPPATPAPTTAVGETRPTAVPPTPASATEAPTAPPPAESPTSAAKEPTPAPVGSAQLAVVRGADPAAITERALAAIGGIERFVKPGYDVIIKPNICNANHGPEYASTTNPEVVATLVKLCQGAGAKRVRVMDYPFSGTAEAAYVRSGISEAVKAAGGEMEVMVPAKFAKIEIPEGRDIKSWQFYRPVLDADLVINVPIAKHHSLARLTLGCKNLMGVILNRGGIHHNLGQRIADLTSLVRPQLTVVDAVHMLMDHGPTGGNLADVKQANTVIASHDIVAADAYATTLFESGPSDIAYIVASSEMGLGTMALDSVKIAELSI